MSQDIRRCSKEDLDELNQQIAIYKALGGQRTVTIKSDKGSLDRMGQGTTNDSSSKQIAEQLDLFS
jgi:hypothetical protein